MLVNESWPGWDVVLESVGISQTKNRGWCDWSFRSSLLHTGATQSDQVSQTPLWLQDRYCLFDYNNGIQYPLSIMADVASTPNQPPERSLSPTPSSSSSSSQSADVEANHDWVARQMKLSRSKYVEELNIKIKVVSWNVNGKRVAEDLTSLLLEKDSEPEIYAIG